MLCEEYTITLRMRYVSLDYMLWIMLLYKENIYLSTKNMRERMLKKSNESPIECFFVASSKFIVIDLFLGAPQPFTSIHIPRRSELNSIHHWEITFKTEIQRASFAVNCFMIPFVWWIPGSFSSDMLVSLHQMIWKHLILIIIPKWQDQMSVSG